MVQSRLLADLKDLAGKSLVYGLGSIILRGINFFLLPLYTRYLTPADYGIIAVTVTITAILSLLYPLGLHGALTRLYFNTENEAERRQSSGTIWVSLLVTAASMTLLLDRLGSTFFPLLLREVPFEPYIRLSIWIAFFNVLSLLPLNLLQIEERAGSYVLLTVINTLLSIGLVITLVVLKKQGAYGYLLGTLWAGILMAGPYLVLTLRRVQVILRWSILKTALIFSLPLVPHSLASWILDLSDRVILERFVSLSELGLYAMGYQLAGIMTMAATAINNAWVPFLFKTDATQGNAAKPGLARLATYYTLILSWVALASTLLAKEVLILLTAPTFHAAYQIMPWIIAGLLLNGLYFFPVNFLFLKSKTGWVPTVTVMSGLVNVGLNLWLTPSYGIMAAAWTTLLAYAVMLLLVWFISQRIYPFPYEYRRLGIIMLVTMCLFALGTMLQSDSMVIDLGIKATLLLAYPLVLMALSFYTSAEKVMMLNFVQQILRGKQRTVFEK